MCCPSCSSDIRISNHIPETPYRLLAERAWEFREIGQMERAADALMRFAGVQIRNFTRPKWLCLECGARYND